MKKILKNLLTNLKAYAIIRYKLNQEIKKKKEVDTMTKREFLNAVIATIEGNDTEINVMEMLDYANTELRKLDERNLARTSKPTATQKANEVLKEAIIAGMAHNKIYTIAEIVKEIPECAELSNQKVAAMLNQLKVDEKVEKITDKRKIYWKVIW